MEKECTVQDWLNYCKGSEPCTLHGCNDDLCYCPDVARIQKLKERAQRAFLRGSFKIVEK